MSATGDPTGDRLVGPAMRLAGGSRMWDGDEVRAAFADAARVVDGDELQAARALAIVCAAMVPWDGNPSELLRWTRREDEFHRLVAVGVDPASAADVCSGMSTATTPERK